MKTKIPEPVVFYGHCVAPIHANRLFSEQYRIHQVFILLLPISCLNAVNLMYCFRWKRLFTIVGKTILCNRQEALFLPLLNLNKTGSAGLSGIFGMNLQWAKKIK
ncbi:hypothetical protein ACDQ55_20330 [Chitinophaga sp. 30R24]|uniref:hypothetical protein n=1 Tax=Chitinophaga sp. 30R24 TaxID=3248838 RepID=UPI003B8EDE00